MSDFTYALPFSNEKYLSGILYELKRNGKYDVAHLLRVATVSVEQGSYYVGRCQCSIRQLLCSPSIS
jgi:hypothetical protein